ncbi:MAG: RNA methyltransferase [Vicinamibacterales bacterium]
MNSITSRQNPIARAFRELASTPDAAGVRLLLDGIHLVRDARAAGLELEVVAVASGSLDSNSEEAALALVLEREGVEVISASEQAFALMSPVRTPSGIVAIARRVPTTATSICVRPGGFILVVVDVQDPGNLGSLLRAAEAGGVTGVLVCGASTSPFSWKALRGSMGSALRLPIVHGLPLQSVLTCLEQHDARTVAAVPRDGRAPDDIDWTGRVGLVLGGEGHGLDEIVAARCAERVSIPMAPPVESLNVAAAAAILVYTARRQRAPLDVARSGPSESRRP